MVSDSVPEKNSAAKAIEMDHEQVPKLMDPHYRVPFLRSSVVPNNQVI